MATLIFIGVLILIFIVTRFIMRGLFDPKWRKNIQEIIDSIKRERIFWNLMNGAYDNLNLNVRGVFSLYVISLTRELKAGDLISMREFMRKDTISDNLDKNIIKKNGSFKNIEILNHAIEEREKFIEEFFDKETLTFTKTEIDKRFEFYSIWNEQPSNLYLKLLNNKKTGMAIWKARKELVDEAHNLEFDPSGNHCVDKSILESLKMTQARIGEVVISLISEKIENKVTAKKIEKSLREWEQLHMLRWCVAKHFAAWGQYAVIKITFWRIVEYVFL